MIKKLIDKLLGKAPGGKPAAPAPGPVLGQRVEVPHTEHGIDPALVDERALRVVQTLADAGHEAYIVGGAVRDLLLGLRPKDFDVATSATPEQVKALFRRAFIIGRRFRIVHVVFGRGREHEVIEVSTFRALMDPAAAEAVDANEKTVEKARRGQPEVGNTRVVDAEGRVLRDNVWGPQIEDAARRDFTVNAMYYDPQRRLVVDYHGGLQDARAKLLRMIGDPATRYREDPVRIVRVVRFAAKLGFEIEPATRAPLREMAALLEKVPPSRLFDEMIKLLQTGHASASVAELRKQGLSRGLFPVLDAAFADGPGAAAPAQRQRFVELALADTDRRVAEGKPVAPSFLLACLLWHDVQQGWQALKDRGEAPFPALQQAVDAVFDARVGDISGRGKLGADMREVWMMQPRFERRVGNAPFTLAEQPRFRAGFDFLRLRADVGEVDAALAEWWEDFSLEPEEGRRAMLDELKQKAARRVPGARRAVPAGAPSSPPADGGA
ncbi:polynucleotide adenylyltransferase PcnB [Piscinibacter sakaiensis]|uniref:polynucleotide adenylyltransferase PcnB n=1 Tax=Piscinibacter sakaiensis TaxID=1547922 RepID=UPI0037268898